MAGPRRSRCNCIRGAFSTLSSSSVKRRRRHAFFCTKFLDTYCGCSEDGSLHADCSMNFTSGKHQKGIKPLLMHSMPEAVDLGDVSHLEDPQLILTPGISVLPVTESHSDTYMELEDDFQTPVEIIVDAQEMKDSVKSPDYVERLACKYMQKCVVESSTESESESSTEVTPSPLAGGLKKARDSRRLQFSDPYDGDSEDASIHSDCSLNSLNSVKVAPWVNNATKAMALGDADTSEDGESFPKPPDWLCPETKVSETQKVNDCKELLELPSQEKDFLRSLLHSSEQPRATEAFSSLWLTPDHSLLMSINPSTSADLLASPSDSAPQPILTADCDGTMAKQPLIKRKQGIPIPEGASEKLRRKKLRAT